MEAPGDTVEPGATTTVPFIPAIAQKRLTVLQNVLATKAPESLNSHRWQR